MIPSERDLLIYMDIVKNPTIEQCDKIINHINVDIENLEKLIKCFRMVQTRAINKKETLK